MIKNYLKIALRNLRKYKTYAVINMAGLAVGMAGCLLIVLFVQDELNYERFHDNADRIVRLVEDQVQGDRVGRLATTYTPLAPALTTEFPAVEAAVRFYPYPVLVRYGDAKKFQEDHFVLADSTVFDVFSFRLIRGEADAALAQPFTVVLTASTARKYFDDADPIGQVLTVRDDDGERDYTVTGVVEDAPRNSHLQFDMLASYSSSRIFAPWMHSRGNWDWPPIYTYALLADGADPAALEAQLPALAQKYMGERRSSYRTLLLEPLTRIRLFSQRENEPSPTSDITYVSIFSLIAFFILLIACINFMNLATARAANRAREVGMRKVLGAQRTQLIRQFLSESILLAMLAMVLAIVLIELLLPALNAVSGKALTTASLFHWTTPLALLAMVLFVGVLAGSYPAFYLSASRPIRSLRGAKERGGSAAATLRKGLVVFQFAVSIVLIVGTTIIFRQLDYIQNQRLGFDKEHVVVVPLRDQADQINSAALKQQWQQIPNVLSVAATSGVPGIASGLHDFWVFPDNTRQDSLELMTLTVDHDFVETLGLDLLAGRDFSEDFPTDATEAFLINESAAKKLGWTDPIGQEFTLRYYVYDAIMKRGAVIGLVRDFQYHSLHRAIDPTVLHIVTASYYSDYITARIGPRDVPKTLARMAERWQSFNADRPFEYVFLDETFDALYRAEERLGRLFGYFSILAILIACLGLFGLAAFTAEQRTKEIGVRKVMGATVGGIVMLLSKDLLKLIAVAFVVGAPLAYVAMNQWLLGFADRVALSWPIFLTAGLAALGIAWLTVGYHALKAALADPVTALRYE